MRTFCGNSSEGCQSEVHSPESTVQSPGEGAERRGKRKITESIDIIVNCCKSFYTAADNPGLTHFRQRAVHGAVTFDVIPVHAGATSCRRPAGCAAGFAESSCGKMGKETIHPGARLRRDATARAAIRSGVIRPVDSFHFSPVHIADYATRNGRREANRSNRSNRSNPARLSALE